MFSRSLGGTVVAVIIAIVAISYKAQHKNRIEQDCKESLHTLVSQCDCYQTRSVYLDTLCDLAHSTAFADSYRSGGRYSSGRFDEARYLSEAMDFMLVRARKDGYKDVVASLERLADADPVPPPGQ